MRRNFDSLLIIISSHGSNHQISLPGGERESIWVVEDIMIPFSDTEFPQFEGKPKVIMPMTCQALDNVALDSKPSNYSSNRLFDWLVCCPCLPGCTTTRFPGKGSYYMHCLIDNLTKYAMSWHLTAILDKVNQKKNRESIQ